MPQHVSVEEVRRRAVEITHEVYAVTQPRIKAAAVNPLSGGLEECLAQAAALGAMFNIAALQFPPAEGIAEFVQAIVGELLRDMIEQTDRPVLYGAAGEIANAGALKLNPPPNAVRQDLLDAVDEALAPPDTSDWTCKVCGCADDKPCPDGCSWVAERVCSECAPQEQIKIGTLADFVGQAVIFTDGRTCARVESVDDDGIAVVMLPSGMASKYWAGTGCILFTGESIYGRGQRSDPPV